MPGGGRTMPGNGFPRHVVRHLERLRRQRLPVDEAHGRLFLLNVLILLDLLDKAKPSQRAACHRDTPYPITQP
jgi:hypothetical protein